MLARYAEVARRILTAYDEYDYPTIFQTVNAFMSVDLSALYSDISKDRLYTFAAGSRERRSAQTAMYVMADGLARLLAPILPVSAEQLWTHHAAGRGTRRIGASGALPAAAADVEPLADRRLLDVWERLLRDPRRQSTRHSSACAKASRSARRSRRRSSITAERRRPRAAAAIPRRSCRCCSSCPKSSSRNAGESASRTGHVVTAHLASNASAAGVTCRRCRPIRANRHLRALPGRAGRRPSRPDGRAFATEPAGALAIAAIIVVLDQATKALVRAKLPLHESVTVIPGLLRPDACAQHGRGVRHAEQRGFRVQAGRHGRSWRSSRWPPWRATR